MPSTYQIERNRGTKEARQQLAALRKKWPLAFPAKPEDVRPLAVGAAREIAAAMGWSLPYTLGVLVGWMRIPKQSGHRFRRKAATQSDRKRPPNPNEGGHPVDGVIRGTLSAV